MVSSNGAKRTALEAAELNGDQSGKIFLITGAYSGIGVETTKALLQVKGKVILAGRNPDAMAQFVQQLIQQQQPDGVDASTLVDGDGPPCDLGNLSSVAAFGKYVTDKYQKVDVLILNAGVVMTKGQETQQGLETTVGTNVVGHFLLAHKLLPITKRQVWVASNAHEMPAKRFDFAKFKAFATENKYEVGFWYQQSKLGNILLAKEFAKRHSTASSTTKQQLEAVSLHPGVIRTNLFRHLPGFVTCILVCMMRVGVMKQKTAEQGASTTVACATLPSDKLQNGAYYEDCEVGTENDVAKDQGDAKELYDICLDLTKGF